MTDTSHPNLKKLQVFASKWKLDAEKMQEPNAALRESLDKLHRRSRSLLEDLACNPHGADISAIQAALFEDSCYIRDLFEKDASSYTKEVDSLERQMSQFLHVIAGDLAEVFGSDTLYEEVRRNLALASHNMGSLRCKTEPVDFEPMSLAMVPDRGDAPFLECDPVTQPSQVKRFRAGHGPFNRARVTPRSWRHRQRIQRMRLGNRQISTDTKHLPQSSPWV
ncbi:hypothetical protein HIM_11028 [Hirsutella minnesotensis 3608]|uniref:Uncharacterized protein n=1 Tax=Hirsutella minnesotensis 3608 TaxID=1043627 RepID=A0A0F7ZFR3_9HYPO|nr:hypothetical protein HIM_11028 [Hirsutella minnesotensis 3608]